MEYKGTSDAVQHFNECRLMRYLRDSLHKLRRIDAAFDQYMTGIYCVGTSIVTFN